jgi:two-component system chemotaxis response regulator CheB
VNKLTVIVVDDSALMRKIISDMINEENDMEVISIARNGEELIEKLKTLKPDVVTLDVEMPKMDGVTALKNLKESKKDVKVIMLSSLTSSSSNLTLECLDLGAADFVQKPSGSISLDINKVK